MTDIEIEYRKCLYFVKKDGKTLYVVERLEAAKLFKEVYLETGSPLEARKAVLRVLP